MMKISAILRGEEGLYRSLLRLEGKVKNGANKLTEDAAEWLVNDIRSSWSPTRQTRGSGNPPSVKTGNLDSSVIVDEQGRDVLGRFARSGDVTVRFVRVDTSEGDDPQGRGNYAQALEDENYYNLPFMQPALDRLEQEMPRIAKRSIRL